MDFNTKKILKFLIKNKNKNFSIIKLSESFPKISKDHLIEIINNLYKDKYIKYVGDTSIKITNKGITYISVIRDAWLSEHIIEILALITAFISLIFSIFALVKTY